MLMGGRDTWRRVEERWRDRNGLWEERRIDGSERTEGKITSWFEVERCFHKTATTGATAEDGEMPTGTSRGHDR